VRTNRPPTERVELLLTANESWPPPEASKPTALLLPAFLDGVSEEWVRVLAPPLVAGADPLATAHPELLHFPPTNHSLLFSGSTAARIKARAESPRDIPRVSERRRLWL
jgi:hypothetical protein